MRRRALVAALTTAFLASCGNSPSSSTPTPSPAPGAGPGAPGTRMTIAVIPKGTTHEFWRTVEAGATKAAKELDIEMIWKGPAREDDRDEQIKVVENFVTRKVAGIVIAPLDAEALVRPLREASDAGIKVTIFDSSIAWDGHQSFVATDNHKGGTLAAEELGRLLGGKGKVVMMRYVEGSASTMEREAGFLETLQEKFPDIEVLSSDQFGGATLESCLKTAENLLTRFPQFDGAFAPNEPSAAAFMKAINDAKRKDAIRLVGFDASAALVDGLRSGKVDALVVQNPFRMGELAVRTMVDALKGKDVEKRVDTGCALVTKATMDEPAVKDVLSPDLSKWLK